MIDPYRMAERHRIQQLQKCSFGHEVVSNVVAPFCDARKKVALGTKFQDHIGAVIGVHYLHQGNNIWVVAGLMMELYFPLLKFALPGV